jgi:phage shock protein B
MEIIPQTVAALGVLVGLPWLVLHYITQWKKGATLTIEDERLLDELHDLARRLDDRVCTVERIMTAENPNWRSLGCDPATTGIEDGTRDNLANIRRER